MSYEDWAVSELEDRGIPYRDWPTDTLLGRLDDVEDMLLDDLTAYYERHELEVERSSLRHELRSRGIQT